MSTTHQNPQAEVLTVHVPLQLDHVRWIEDFLPTPGEGLQSWKVRFYSMVATMIEQDADTYGDDTGEDDEHVDLNDHGARTALAKWVEELKRA